MNLQYPPVHQWPYTPQQVESPSLIVPNRCQQLSHLQPNPVRNQVQQGHPPLHLAQSTVPFWLPPRTGYQVSGVNMPATFQTFTPLGTINGSWQAPAMTGVNSSSNQPQVPNLCYPVGYPYTGFPGSGTILVICNLYISVLLLSNFWHIQFCVILSFWCTRRKLIHDLNVN